MKVMLIGGFGLGGLLLALGMVLFASAPRGGREEALVNAAAQDQAECRENERQAAANYRRSIGMDKSQEPAGDGQWLDYQESLRSKQLSYTKLAAAARRASDDALAQADMLRLERHEHLVMSFRLAALFSALGLIGLIGRLCYPRVTKSPASLPGISS